MHTAIELLTRILCDPTPLTPAYAAYLFCTTEDNQPSVFQAAAEVLQQAQATRILILESEPMSGYPGDHQARQRMMHFGIPQDAVDGVPLKRVESINTLVEAQALIDFARDRSVASLIVVSPPFHQLRAFMTTVTVALKEYPDISIYSRTGFALPWLETVVHSQGTLTAARRQLIQEEVARIATYQAKGDLAPFEAVLEYLDRRKEH